MAACISKRALLRFWVRTRVGSPNMSYVNPFVQGLWSAPQMRFSSTVDRRRPITKVFVKRRPVVSESDCVSSPHSDGFRF